MHKISLSEKLIIAFVLISIGAIAIIGIYSYRSVHEAQMERTYDQLASVRYLKKKQVEAFYADRIAEVKALSVETALIQLLAKPYNPDYSYKSISPVLLNSINSHGYYNRLFLFSKGHLSPSILKTDSNKQTQSNGIYSIPDSLFRIVTAKGKPVISDLLQHDHATTEGWFQLIIIPVFINNSLPLAAVAVELSTVALDRIMLDNNPHNGLGNSGESYLVGKDRFLRSSSRFINNSIFHTLIDTSTIGLAFGGSDGYWLLNDYRGVEVLGSFSELSPPCPAWAVIAEIDMHEAMAPIITIRNNIIFLSVFITLVVFIATWLISRKITRPIIKLQRAAQELGKGKLGTQVAVVTNDEIGELSQSFNLMSEQLMEKEVLLQHERIRRMRAAFDGQDAERHRLSRELHDGLGQSLIAQKLRLESLKLPASSETNVLLDEMKLCSDKLVDDVRRISNDLMPAQLTQFGIVPALRQHCDEVSRYSGIEVSFDSTGNFDTMRRKVKTYLFRIIQEALNNIVKHAGSKTALVEIVQTREHYFLSISDDGKGFNTEKPCSGNGLNNMRERTLLIGGSFSITSQPGSGTTIEIQIPSKG
jgi:signal transduction histidine kinase